MAATLLLLVVVGLVLAVGTSVLRRKRLPAGARPLPGPWGLPFIGRVHDVPEEASWLKFYEWSQQYGPIYQMEIFGSVHVWISSEQVAHDLLSKKASIYSDRPMIPNLPDNRTSGDYLALQGSTDTWKRQRKLASKLMTASDRASLHSYPAQERDRFLYLLGEQPDAYIEWIEQFTSRTVARLSWGSAHPAQLLRYTTFGLLETISPSGALPNVLAFLRHVPAALSPWKKKENARHELENRLFQSSVGFVQQEMAAGRAEPSFVRTFLESKAGSGDNTQANEKKSSIEGDTREAMYVVGQMAIAGALTIGSPIQSYFLAMCHYPDAQRQLQEEIDTVLGGRCPEWEDREKLPMVRAVVKEVIRWRPPVPTGIPHAIEKDDVYNGYFIPAGATIHALEWGITRDQEKYPDPDTFNPNRWLDPTFPTYRAPLTQHPSLSGFSQFGFGRRVCQGIPIVEQDLFLAFSGLAWAFDVRKARDAAGAEIPVHWNDFTPLLIAKPKKFRFDLVPRSEERRALLKTRYASVVDAAEEGRVRKMEAEIGTRYEDVAGAEGVMMRGGKKEDDGMAETTVVVPGEVNCESESDHDVLVNMGTPSSEGDDGGVEDEKLLLSKLAGVAREVPEP